MQKAFIFDVDGTLANTSPAWEEGKKEIYPQFFDKNIVSKMGSTVGVSLEGIYDRATEHGVSIDKEAFFAAFYKKANEIYEGVPLTKNLEKLGNKLTELGFVIGIVSASPMKWINPVIDRLPFKANIQVIISLEDRSDLAHKPAPDGYLEAIRELNSIPESTIILEDSNSGIESAKASGAYVIALKENIIEGYEQEGADSYARTVEDVIDILEKRTYLI